MAEPAMGAPVVPLAQRLLVAVEELAPLAGPWIDAAREVAAAFDASAFNAAFAGAGRTLGRRPVDPGSWGASRPSVEALLLGGRAMDEVGRAALLLGAAARLPATDLDALVEDCYAHGDTRERQAVLRALTLLPAPERHRAIALDACRTSIVPLFEAIACENPYPAAHFEEPAFNQMALKAVFLGVAVERIVGLAGRRTDELARMARDYASERRAAGRPVPPDVARLGGEA